MENIKIAIIGGGNLGLSIVEGLLKSSLVKPAQLTVTRRNLKKVEDLKTKGIIITSDNSEAVKDASVVLICVKPWQIREVLIEMRHELDKDKLVISAVTGFSLSQMEEIVGNNFPIVRAMPNTAIAVQESMTCISARNINESQRTLIINVFDQLGKTLFINEELMDAATVLGACGIAYCLRFIRAASQGGIEIGFSADSAQFIAAQTAKGAASLLLQHNSHPESEIDKVTTPRGCTIAGLNEMEHQGFSSSLIKGIRTSFKKID